VEVQPAASEPVAQTQEKMSWRQFVLELAETVLLAVVLFVGINLISARVRVEGYSMRPTLDDGQYMLVSRLAYLRGGYQRGDVIIFRPPMHPEESLWRRLLGFPGLHDHYEDYVKRIIGLPGDTVKIENGQVFVNGQKLDEPYISEPPRYSGEWTVPDGHLFVLGDNRNDSSDSHQWNFLPQENVIGKALLVYWPLTDIMVLKSNQAAQAAP
jgi:signal peptidase I